MTRQHQRQFLFEFWQLHFAHRIMSQFFSSCEKLIKGAQRGELQPHVRPRLPSLHERKEIIAKIVGWAFFPRGFVRRWKSFQRLLIPVYRMRRTVSVIRKVAQE